MLKGFGAVPPFITDINLSLDDKLSLRVVLGFRRIPSIRRQRSVPAEIERHDPYRGHRAARRRILSKPGTPLNGGPQMVEVSRDGRRVYVTNSLYTAVDDQFYPDGIKGWMMKLDVDPITGEMHVDPRFFPHFDGMRPHQTRLEGGDASSDSYCYA